MIEQFESDRAVRECPLCRRQLPIAMFPTRKKGHHEYGYCYECVAQRRIDQRRRYFPGNEGATDNERRPEPRSTPMVVPANSDQVECTRCGKLLPIQAYPVKRHGLHSQPCRACTRELRAGERAYAEPSLWSGNVESAMRLCIGCNTVQPIMTFPVDTRGRPFGHLCLPCRKVKRREENQANPEAAKRQAHNRHLRRVYGITLEQYEDTLAAQNGACAICRRPEEAATGIDGGKGPRRLAVDHDHANGRLRGLLCTRCNQGLGYFKHELPLLEYAVAYLKMHDEQ